MKRDFTKQKMGRRSGKRLLVGVMLLLFIVMGIVLVVSQYQKLTGTTNFVTAYIQRTKSWVSAGKGDSQRNLVSAKNIAIDRDAQPDIHFEFYSTLPNMRVNVQDAPIVTAKSEIFDAGKLQRSLQEELNKNSTSDKPFKAKKSRK